MFYDVRHKVSRELHAVERNRILSGLALGYAPKGAPDFGLDRTRLADPDGNYVVLLHATARPEKQWPEKNWIALGHSLATCGLDFVLPWGSAEERARSERIAAALPRARVCTCPSCTRSFFGSFSSAPWKKPSAQYSLKAWIMTTFVPSSV